MACLPARKPALSLQSEQSFSTPGRQIYQLLLIKFAQEKPYPAVISLSDHRDPRIRARPAVRRHPPASRRLNDRHGPDEEDMNGAVLDLETEV